MKNIQILLRGKSEKELLYLYALFSLSPLELRTMEKVYLVRFRKLSGLPAAPPPCQSMALTYLILYLKDEPTSGMDPYSRRFLWDVIQRLVQAGTSVVFSSHRFVILFFFCVTWKGDIIIGITFVGGGGVRGVIGIRISLSGA